jgi:predicted permease
MRKSSSMLPRGIRRLFRLPDTRERLMRDADDEMRTHLEMWADEFRSRGMSDAEATAAAMARFGDHREYLAHVAERAERRVRWQRVVDWLAEWRQDMRFALRHFSKSPAFTLIAVATLALGIGANTAIFSVIHSLLIDPIPYANGDRIVALKTIGHPGFVAGLASVGLDDPSDPSPLLLKEWVARARSYQQVAGVDQRWLAIRGDGEQDTVSHAVVTANFLDVLGTRPSFGRGFRPEEEQKGANHVAMISHRWWQLAYGGSTDVLGKTLEYEGENYTIVGVMPVGFTIPMSPRVLDNLSVPIPDVWVPAPIANTSIGFGLLRRGVSQATATAELNAIANQEDVKHTAFPFLSPKVVIRARAMRPQDFLGARELRTIEILFAAVGALLLIACANVANLLLIRAWTRRREFAVRMGLGAGRARLLRLALTESVMLAIAAGIIGSLIAWQALRIIIALRPIALDRLVDVRIEPAVLFWTAGISIVTGILFGGAAAIAVASQNIADLLRNETRTASGGSSSRRVRASLIVVEIALSFALLVGAGLLTRSFVALQKTRLGFDPHNLVSIDVLVPGAITRSPRRVIVRQAITRRLSETRGVTSAALGMLPTAGTRSNEAILVDTPDGIHMLGLPEHMVTHIEGDFFRTSGIALIAGRAPRLGPTDEPPATMTQLPPPPGPSPGSAAAPKGPQAPPARTMSEEVVVSRALARRLFADGNAVGKRIRLASPPGMPSSDDWSTIVGISDDVRLPGVRTDLQDYQIYMLPMRFPPVYVVRFASMPPSAESVLRDAIHSVDPTLIARRARVGDDYVENALAPTRFTLALLGAFAGVALVLAVVGLYGSIAYTVTQRTREIGIRIALGASSKAVTGLVVSDGLRLATIGLLIGLFTAIAATRALSSLLYSVGTGDPMTYIATSVLVAVTALAASYIPARRAMRIDPVDALRAD